MVYVDTGTDNSSYKNSKNDSWITQVFNPFAVGWSLYDSEHRDVSKYEEWKLNDSTAPYKFLKRELVAVDSWRFNLPSFTPSISSSSNWAKGKPPTPPPLIRKIEGVDSRSSLLQSLVEVDSFLSKTASDLVSLAERESNLKRLELKERRNLAEIKNFLLTEKSERFKELFKRMKEIFLDEREKSLREQRRLVETNIVLANRLSKEGVDSKRVEAVFKDLTELRRAVGEKDSLLSTETAASELVTYRVRDYLLAKSYN